MSRLLDVPTLAQASAAAAVQLREANQVSRHLWLGNLAPDADRATLLNVAQVSCPPAD